MKRELVGNRASLEIVALLGFFELEMFAFSGLHPRFKLSNMFIHSGICLASNLARFSSPTQVINGLKIIRESAIKSLLTSPAYREHGPSRQRRPECK